MTPSAPASRLRRILLALVIVVTALALLGIVAVVNLFTLTREASALRKSVVSVSSLQPQLLVQGSVGSVVLAGLRVGTRWIPDLPDDAKLALGALRSVSAAVYQLDGAPSLATRAEMFDLARSAMQNRGWHSTVQVGDGETGVLVLTRDLPRSSRSVRVCIAVCTGTNLVLAEATLKRSEVERVLAQLSNRSRVI